jgi:DNA-binding MarR family transcriptional regulator
MKSVILESERSVETAARLRLVMVRLARALRHQGSTALSPSQVSALASVDEYGPLRISALATLESVGAPVATRVVASLEELDLLTRTEDPDDRRASLVELSEHGRTVLAALWSERTIGLSSRVDALTPAERNRLELALPALEKLAREN